MDERLAEKRLRKTRFYCAILQRLPFVRCIILTGSLARGKSKENSDIDLLIIAEDGRIFTARFFCNLILILLGQKRPKDEDRPHAGKFCLNYFLTESYLIIPTGRGAEIDRYCAQSYSKSIFISGDPLLFKRFIDVNTQLFNQYHPVVIPGLTRNLDSCFRRNDKRWGESLLRGKFGNWIEIKLKAFQVKKIESDPRSEKYPDLIVYSDRELRFHPPKEVAGSEGQVARKKS